jgi:hypothetical protein
MGHGRLVGIAVPEVAKDAEDGVGAARGWEKVLFQKCAHEWEGGGLDVPVCGEQQRAAVRPDGGR